MAKDDALTFHDTSWDITRFRTVPDRMQQAIVDFLFLARALSSDGGFRDDDSFRSPGGDPVLDGTVAWLGASQGGIVGGAVSALADSWTNVVLVSAGMNFSTMLDRSALRDRFFPDLTRAYPDPVDHQVVLGLLQMLWDRGEDAGYANHLTRDPLPGAGTKRVLVVASLGDHTVANVASDTLARTLDAKLREPAVAPGRDAGKPFWGFDAVPGYPYAGSAYVVFDDGTPPAPAADVPATQGDDPHGKAVATTQVVDLAAHYLETGELIDVCEGPCR
jgi:hypothetical protein